MAPTEQARQNQQVPFPEALKTPPGIPCTVCSHPDREKFDAELCQSGHSLSRIAEKVGCSPQSIQRHRDNHLPARLIAASEALVAERDKQFAKLAITSSVSRLNDLQGLLDGLKVIQQRRAEKAVPEAPGSETGLLVVRKKAIRTVDGKFEQVLESEIDQAMLAEVRALHRAAAIETGEYLAQMGRGQFGAGEGGKGPLVVVMTSGLQPLPGDQTPGDARHRIVDARRQKTLTAQEAEAIPLALVDIEQTPEYVPDTREQSLSGEDLEIDEGGPECVAGGDEDSSE